MAGFSSTRYGGDAHEQQRLRRLGLPGALPAANDQPGQMAFRLTRPDMAWENQLRAVMANAPPGALAQMFGGGGPWGGAYNPANDGAGVGTEAAPAAARAHGTTGAANTLTPSPRTPNHNVRFMDVMDPAESDVLHQQDLARPNQLDYAPPAAGAGQSNGGRIRMSGTAADGTTEDDANMEALLDSLPPAPVEKTLMSALLDIAKAQAEDKALLLDLNQQPYQYRYVFGKCSFSILKI